MGIVRAAGACALAALVVGCGGDDGGPLRTTNGFGDLPYWVTTGQTWFVASESLQSKDGDAVVEDVEVLGPAKRAFRRAYGAARAGDTIAPYAMTSFAAAEIRPGDFRPLVGMRVGRPVRQVVLTFGAFGRPGTYAVEKVRIRYRVGDRRYVRTFDWGGHVCVDRTERRAQARCTDR